MGGRIYAFLVDSALEQDENKNEWSRVKRVFGGVRLHARLTQVAMEIPLGGSSIACNNAMPSRARSPARTENENECERGEGVQRNSLRYCIALSNVWRIFFFAPGLHIVRCASSLML